ncbi:FG-GAP-like repeat-containing protein [Streptomyces omiyaensis]|uniref:FG-GAP-like repeat-containing protein n=1 Tax=Streptomyces omiyaensis TaxID=68247 RepID=A0ABW7BUH7_9ACTN
MKRTAWWRVPTAALAAALTALAPTPPQARADVVGPSTAPQVRAVTYNLCGSGATTGCDPSAEANEVRYGKILDETAPTGWGAGHVSLVEVCRYQFDQLAVRLGESFAGHYVSTARLAPGRCANPLDPADSANGDYGMAVLVRGEEIDRTVIELDTAAEINAQLGITDPAKLVTEDIRVPCLKTLTSSGPVWTCSVHLFWGTPGAAGKYVMDEEAALLARRAALWEDEGTPVILAGDFNTSPWTTVLSHLYAPAAGENATGRFLEADETDPDHFTGHLPDAPACPAGAPPCRRGEITYLAKGKPASGQKKIDYVFFGSKFFRNPVGDALPDVDDPHPGTWVSDHVPLRGAAEWICGPSDTTDRSVLRRGAKGVLFRHALDSAALPGTTAPTLGRECRVGTGWNALPLVTRQGTDLLGVDTTGTLWRYKRTPDGTYSGSGDNREKIGSGFTGLNLLLAPGDFDGDAQATPDLLGRDAQGVLRLYRGTGTGYAPGEPIGTNWNIYPILVAPGDFAGDAHPDLLGIDATGNLYLYTGTGRPGHYAQRTSIGKGWNTYNTLTTPGDVNGDHKPDLIGRDTTGATWFYSGTGTAPYYTPRRRITDGTLPPGHLIL